MNNNTIQYNKTHLLAVFRNSNCTSDSLKNIYIEINQKKFQVTKVNRKIHKHSNISKLIYSLLQWKHFLNKISFIFVLNVTSSVVELTTMKIFAFCDMIIRKQW